MAIVISKLRITDLQNFREAFAAAEDYRREAGLSLRGLYRDWMDDDRVLVVLEAESLDKARRFYGSSAQRERMARAGVQGPPDMWLGEDLPEEIVRGDRPR